MDADVRDFFAAHKKPAGQSHRTPEVVVQRGGVYIHQVAAGGTVVIYNGSRAGDDDPDQEGDRKCAKRLALPPPGPLECAKRTLAALARAIATNVRICLAKSAYIREFLRPPALLKEICVS